MSAGAEEGETGSGGDTVYRSMGEAPSPKPRRLSGRSGLQFARTLVLRVVVGFGLLAILTVCWLSVAAPFAEVRREAASVVMCLWGWLGTGLAWLAMAQGRLAGVIQDKRAWFDLSRPLEPGMERIFLLKPASDWAAILCTLVGLLLAGVWGIVLWLEQNNAGVWFIAWLLVLLSLGVGFLSILWRRVTQMMVLTGDRIIWHLGPCQVQIPYAQLEEVLRGSRRVSFESDRREIVLVTRGMMTVVAHPRLPIWLLYWLLPRRELVVQSGLAHESFRFRPVHELLALEALAEHAPHLVARGPGLLVRRSDDRTAAPTGETARSELQQALADQADQRVNLVPNPFRSVLLNLFIWLAFPSLALILLDNAPSGFLEGIDLQGWLQVSFVAGLLGWFLTMGLWLLMSQLKLQRSKLCDLPGQLSRERSFRQAPGRWAWLGYLGQVIRLMVLGLGLLMVGPVRVATGWPYVGILEGLGAGLWLTLGVRLLRQAWIANRGTLSLLNDRVLCDRGWTRAAIVYQDLQEAMLTACPGGPEEPGELRLRSAVPVKFPARRSWWSIPRLPPVGGLEIPPYWQHRAWLVTLAEPERFLRELGPYVPHLVRCDTGWIIPLPSTEHPAVGAGEMAAEPATDPAAQSTTNSTSRQ